MAKYVIRTNDESFDLKKCKLNCCCCIDPVKTLVEGYKSFVWERFENCLRAKWSIGDCVVGCHNEIYNENDSTRRNSHQRRVSKKLIASLIEALENADDFPEYPTDFEAVYNWVGSYVEFVRKNIRTPELEEVDFYDDESWLETSEELSVDICPLLKYDTALRMCYNMAGSDGEFISPEENHCLPKNMVYLQSGALYGARELLKICKLSHREAALINNRNKFILKDYITLDSSKELENPDIVEITNFNSDLQSLGSYHLENFLCIYHRLFKDWATGYEIRVIELEKANNLKNKIK